MLFRRELLFTFVLFFTLFGASEPASIINSSKATITNAEWWKHAVFYQIYPKSFKDSDGNGMGDIKGIISKLGHLKDAGVTAAWLSPIYKSPQADQGYDISDFRDIDPIYGTLTDFKELVTKAHDLGIKIVMDFVPNHSSDQHDWFDKSKANDPAYRDYYIWKEGTTANPPNNWISVFGGSAWECDDSENMCYLHAFLKEQPDLNYDNPAVVEEMKDVLKFWMDLGVDGFRMDAVTNIMEHPDFPDEPKSNLEGFGENDYKYLDHIYTIDQAGTYNLIYEWRAFIEEYNAEKGGDPRIMMTEAYTNIKNTMKYYGDEGRDGAHFTFNFLFITEVNKESTARNIVEVIKKWLAYMPIECTPNWVLGNHDNHRVATRFGPDRVDNFNMLTALLPGIMVTYNGEEIGQEDGEVPFSQCQDNSACQDEQTFLEKSRDFERTPFHWDNTANAGFSTNPNTWLPVSQKYLTNNLAAQNVPHIKSHYNDYKALLYLRQQPAFVSGSFDLRALSDNVIGFKREVPNGDSYLVIINNGDEPESIDLSLFKFAQKFMRVVVADVHSSKQNRILSTKTINVAAYESFVAKVIPDEPAGSSDWWEHAVFYQIYPRSFRDENNDGIGDLQGIINKMDHLKDAGVTAVWLSPIYKSPQVDQGYDISDYTDIDDDYGSLDDFDALVQAAHSRGIKVVMDFVPNHSSNQHEWFIKSENKEPGYEDFYVWKNAKNGKPPTNWISLFKYSAWEYSEIRQQYYLHQFAIEQPDLNYNNPAVVEKMTEVLDIWLDRGVDGFRMDAVPYIFEDDQFRDEPLSGNAGVTSDEYDYLKHAYTSDLPGTFDMIYTWRKHLDDYSSEHGGDARIMMTEAYTDIVNTMLYYGDGARNGAHFTFNFQLITKLKQSHNATDIVVAVEEWMEHMPANRVANWVLGNHDNHRVATRFGPANSDGFNMLIALLPGVMVTYNGEEIGQEDGEVTWSEGKDPSACNGNQQDFDKVSRDFERTPFHWDSTNNAGFNQGFKPWLPVSKKYTETNLALQKSSTTSHYGIYRQLIQLRKDNVFQTGNINIKKLSDFVFAFTRAVSKDKMYVFIFNVGDTAASVNADTNVFPDTTPYYSVVLASGQSKHKNGTIIRARSLALQPHEAIIAKTTSETLDDDDDGGKGNTTRLLSSVVTFFVMSISILILK